MPLGHDARIESAGRAKKLATFAAGRGHFALLQLVRGAIDLRGPKGIYLNNYA